MKPFSIPKLNVKSDNQNKVYPILVDIKDGVTTSDTIQFMTGDVGCSYIEAYFYLDNEVFSVQNHTLVCTIQKPDTTIIDIDCTNKLDNKTTILVDSSIEGEHLFEFKIYSQGKILGTTTSSYTVIASI